MIPRALAFICVGVFFNGVAVSEVRSEPLSKLLPNLIESHDQIKAAKLALGAAKDGVDVAAADYMPTVDVSGDYGYEHQNKAPGSDTTSTAFHEASVTGNQLLWDFGKTFAQIDRANISVSQAELRLKSAQQSLIREAVSAYLNLLRVVDTLRFARQSESNIRKQTGLEEALVSRRSGLRTDVLQAKSTLAGAQATRIRAEGQLVSALNRYRTVFQSEPGDLKSFVRPKLPLDSLPGKLDDAIKLALENNVGLKIAELGYESAKKSIEANKATLWGPKVELSAELNFKKNVSGTLDNKIEKLIKVEGSYPLYAGGKDMATYTASLKTAEASATRIASQRRSVEEQVRNAWQSLQTSRSNAQFLRNQSNISGEFLDLARRERRLGRRSLVSILASETSFINSVSAALSAETDTALAFYNLLFAMGQLKVDVFKAEAPKSTN